MPHILGIHALSGCETVPAMSGIRKGRALNAARKVPLSLFMNEDSNVDDYMSEAKQFIAECYGSNGLSSSEKGKNLAEENSNVW